MYKLLYYIIWRCVYKILINTISYKNKHVLIHHFIQWKDARENIPLCGIFKTRICDFKNLRATSDRSRCYRKAINTQYSTQFSPLLPRSVCLRVHETGYRVQKTWGCNLPWTAAAIVTPWRFIGGVTLTGMSANRTTYVSQINKNTKLLVVYKDKFYLFWQQKIRFSNFFGK